MDIMNDIVSLIWDRQNAGHATNCVKVHGHSDDPVHSLADHLAVQGSDQETEDVDQYTKILTSYVIDFI